MRRILFVVALAGPSVLEGQTIEPRSSTYLFAASVEDARALWVNPAGLGILPIASLYLEGTADHGAGDDWGVRQYSFGIHSRSIAVSYQRDRLLAGTSEGTWRVGAAFPLGRRIALGTAVTFSRPQRTIDIGLRFSPVRMFDVGAVLRNVGRPDVRGTEQPMIIAGGVAWYLAQGRVALQADVIARERHPLPGHDPRYRAGAQLVLPGRKPFTLLTAFDLGSDRRVNRWSFGIALGSQAQLIAVGSALPDGGASARLQSFSATALARGVSSRRR